MSKFPASYSGVDGDAQYKPAFPYFELLLFLKDHITLQQMSGNFQGYSSSQNVQNLGVPENTDE
jgi:hypothetical protein